MDPAQEDKRPLARNPREKGLETALDDMRKVAAVRCDQGFIFAFTSHGVETRIALSDDAFWAAVVIAEELLASETKAPNTRISGG